MNDDGDGNDGFEIMMNETVKNALSSFIKLHGSATIDVPEQL